MLPMHFGMVPVNPPMELKESVRKLVRLHIIVGNVVAYVPEDMVTFETSTPLIQTMPFQEHHTGVPTPEYTGHVLVCFQAFDPTTSDEIAVAIAHKAFPCKLM